MSCECYPKMIFRALHRTHRLGLRCEPLFPPFNNKNSNNNIIILLIFLHELLLTISSLTRHITSSLSSANVFTYSPPGPGFSSFALSLTHLGTSPWGRLLNTPGPSLLLETSRWPRPANTVSVGELVSLYQTSLYSELPAVYCFTV